MCRRRRIFILNRVGERDKMMGLLQARARVLSFAAGELAQNLIGIFGPFSNLAAGVSSGQYDDETLSSPPLKAQVTFKR